MDCQQGLVHVAHLSSVIFSTKLSCTDMMGWIDLTNPRAGDQREKLGTLGRVPEIYTNIYHLYMAYIMVV